MNDNNSTYGTISTSLQPPLAVMKYWIHLAIAASLIMVFQTQVQALIPQKTSHFKEEISRRGFAFASLTSTALLPFASNAIIDESQGIPAVTESSLGRSFRRSVVKGAQIADAIDEKWERFSDGLRDTSKCDPKTGRRLYDNGKRKDGTSIGNPGLGSLCNPEPLAPLNTEVVSHVLKLALASAAVNERGEETLREKVKELKALVSPSFERKEQLSTTDEDKERVNYNLEAYAALRAITIYLNNNKQSIRIFQNNWGEQLVNLFAPSATRRDYVSPFPETQDGDYDYDKGKLLDALGKLTVTLTQLKACGIIGFYDISIPYDDYGSVVTIAIDDYVPITAEILLSEQGIKCEGPIQALVRHLLGAAGIDFSLDTFYIDPSTTRQEDYNPTQLLLSVNNLRAF